MTLIILLPRWLLTWDWRFFFVDAEGICPIEVTDPGELNPLTWDILLGTACPKWEASVGISRKADEVLKFFFVFNSSIMFDAPFILNW